MTLRFSAQYHDQKIKFCSLAVIKNSHCAASEYLTTWWHLYHYTTTHVSAFPTPGRSKNVMSYEKPPSIEWLIVAESYSSESLCLASTLWLRGISSHTTISRLNTNSVLPSSYITCHLQRTEHMQPTTCIERFWVLDYIDFITAKTSLYCCLITLIGPTFNFKLHMYVDTCSC